MTNLIEVNEGNFESEVLKANTPVLVDFFAPWCGPCKMLLPYLNTFAGQYAGRVRVAKINVDDSPALAAHFNISGIPTLMLFKGGQCIESIVGMPSPEALKERIDAVCK